MRARREMSGERDDDDDESSEDDEYGRGDIEHSNTLPSIFPESPG